MIATPSSRTNDGTPQEADHGQREAGGTGSARIGQASHGLVWRAAHWNVGWITRLLRMTIESKLVRYSVALMTRVLPTPEVELVHYEVEVAGLPSSRDGLRIVQVSDLHMHSSADLATQIPSLLADVEYDAIVYTGDFIDLDEDLPCLEALLARLPRRAPAYAVLGNHDHLSFGKEGCANNVTRLKSLLTAAGIEVLSNTARPLPGGGVVIAGVDDPATRRDNLDKALRGVPEGTCCLLLAHSPDIALRLRKHRPNLILSGHTHGGQVRLPWYGPVLTMSKIPRRLAMGLHYYAGVNFS